MKRFFILFIVLCCVSNLFGLDWAFSKGNGTLTISGEGPMPDFENKEESGGKDIPWNKYSEDIEFIIINEGITGIGKNAFTHLFKLKKVYFPETLEVIDYGAFDWCPKLQEPKFPEGLKKIGKRAFLYSPLITEVTLQPTVEFDKDFSFSRGTKINIIGIDKEKKSGSF